MIESELRDKKAVLKTVHGFEEWLDLRELKETAASLNWNYAASPLFHLLSLQGLQRPGKEVGLDGDGDLGVFSIHRGLRPRIWVSSNKTSPADISQGCRDTGTRTDSKGKPWTLKERAGGEWSQMTWLGKWKQPAPGALEEFQKARSSDAPSCHREIKCNEDWAQTCWVCRILELSFTLIISIDHISQTILSFQMISQHFAKLFWLLLILTEENFSHLFEKLCLPHLWAHLNITEDWQRSMWQPSFQETGEREAFSISIKKCTLTTRSYDRELSCLCVRLMSTSLILIYSLKSEEM